MSWDGLDTKGTDVIEAVATDKLASPQIGDFNLLVRERHDANLLNIEHVFVNRGHSPVSDHGGNVTPGQLSRENCRLAPEPVPPAAADVTTCLLGVGVLVHRDYVLVSQNVEGSLADSDQVASDDERSFSECPESKVSLFFFVGQTTVADLEHVWVSPRTGPSSLEVFLTNPEVVLDKCPAVSNVLRASPAVGSLGSPLPGVVLAPVAQRVEDGSTGSHERVSHRRVSDLARNGIVVAIVVLKVVDSPISEVLSIFFLVVEGASSFGARLGSSGRVDSELEALVVNVVSNGLHAIGESLRVGNKVTISGSLEQVPAVIQVDVLVADIVQSQFLESVNRLHNQSFADFTSEFVPRVPAHLWRESEPVVDGVNSANESRSNNLNLHLI